MKRMQEGFKGDYRVMKVVMASSDPISTLQSFRSGHYSIKTFLDMLEMLDVKATVEEEELSKIKSQQSAQVSSPQRLR